MLYDIQMDCAAGLARSASFAPYHASLPHLYAPEAGFDPGAVAQKFARQVRRENEAKSLGWSVEDYCSITDQSLSLVVNEACSAGWA